MAEQQNLANEVVLIGATRKPFRDLYHALIRLSWGYTLALIAGAYLALNALFAVAYRAIGGVQGVERTLDYFFFSVQTMGTIGYGAMTPHSVAAHAIVVLQSVVGLVFTAVVTSSSRSSRSPRRAWCSRER